MKVNLPEVRGQVQFPFPRARTQPLLATLCRIMRTTTHSAPYPPSLLIIRPVAVGRTSPAYIYICTLPAYGRGGRVSITPSAHYQLLFINSSHSFQPEKLSWKTLLNILNIGEVSGGEVPKHAN